MKLVKALYEAGCPQEGIKILHASHETIGEILKLPFRMVTFTGGMQAAEKIIQAGGIKKYAMDLGGNAAVIVMDDADQDSAVSECVSGAFWAQGQNCIGVQRIFVHKSIYQVFVTRFVELTETLKVGNPMHEQTDIGPMISDIEARRAEQWILEDIRRGAKLLTGGSRRGAVLMPTVLTQVSRTANISCKEAFAPIVSIMPFDTFGEALSLANDTDVSLHMGIFTQNLDLALTAADKLDAGGVMINDSSDFRFDGMPFGGFKMGSMGREGVQFAVEEMTQPKTVCFTRE